MTKSLLTLFFCLQWALMGASLDLGRYSEESFRELIRKSSSADIALLVNAAFENRNKGLLKACFEEELSQSKFIAAFRLQDAHFKESLAVIMLRSSDNAWFVYENKGIDLVRGERGILAELCKEVLISRIPAQNLPTQDFESKAFREAVASRFEALSKGAESPPLRNSILPDTTGAFREARFEARQEEMNKVPNESIDRPLAWLVTRVIVLGLGTVLLWIMLKKKAKS